MTGKQLQVLRVFYGFETQQMLADALGVHVSTIQVWEKSDFLGSKTVKQLNQLHWNVPKMLNILEGERNRIKHLQQAITVYNN